MKDASEFLESLPPTFHLFQLDLSDPGLAYECERCGSTFKYDPEIESCNTCGALLCACCEQTRCEGCGEHVCKECAREVYELDYCPGCFEEARMQFYLHSAKDYAQEVASYV